MALSRQSMEEIVSFALDSGEGLGTDLLKQQTVPGVGNLIISLGGSGADMLRETKGMISRNCCSDQDKHMSPERVAYVAFDTDPHEKEKVSSEKTGHVSLDDEELMLLSDVKLGLFLDKRYMEFNKAMYPWIYRWLDTKIPPFNFGSGCGAGGIRQAGRAMLFLEIGKVVERLKAAFTGLITGTNVERLNVYLMSGISGGTGSGTFLDMAYIVRRVVNEVIGSGTFRPMNIRIFGYLIMPDVNLLNADAITRPVILRNAGAALQELDHAMGLKETGDYYKCQYSETMTIITNEPPFDYVHLVCAKAKGASMPDKPYQHCLDTVAGSILSFVSDMKTVGGRARAPIHSPLDSYYGVIKNIQVVARARSTYKERPNCYIALGYDCWEIPADRLVKYIFTLMFSKMDALFENEPSQDDANKLMRDLGFYGDQKIMDFLGAKQAPLNPTQFQPGQLFGPEAIELENYLPYRIWQDEVNKNFEKYYQDIGVRLRYVLQQAFLDTERGPIWTNHVLVSGTSARINALDQLVNKQKRLAIQHRTEAQMEQASYIQRINEMRAAYYRKRPVFPARICQEYVGLWNSYFQASMYVYCCELLIGTEDALGQLEGGYKRGFYDEVLNELAVLNNKWLEVTRQVLEELKRIVQQNTDEFRKAAVTDTGRGFTWSSGDIPNLDQAIGGIIARNGLDHDKMMQNFLNLLLSKADEWAQSVEVRKFIEEFLEEEAGCVLGVPLEGLLSSCFDDTKPLWKSIEEDLMPYMVETNAKPLFDGDQDLTYAVSISIPPGCDEIEKGVENYIGGRPNYTLQTSYLRNRISVIRTAAGLSLHDYTLYEKCEQQISLDPGARGLFLYQGGSDIIGSINYIKNPLPSVIPARKRLVMSPAPVRVAQFENELIEEFRQMRRDRYPFLSLTKTPDQEDYNLEILLSVGLDQTDFYEMTQEEKYRNYNGAVDTDKLRDLIAKLETIRYDTGLPEKTGLPKKLIVCEYLLSAATCEMRDRYHSVLPAEEEKVKEEVAWEVAEWYYVSAYSFYMKAKEEKAKYDEIGKKIDELKKQLC